MRSVKEKGRKPPDEKNKGYYSHLGTFWLYSKQPNLFIKKCLLNTSKHHILPDYRNSARSVYKAISIHYSLPHGTLSAFKYA